MRLRYKFGLAAGLAYTAYVVIYGAIIGVHPLALFLVTIVSLAGGIAGMLATSWLFDRLVSNKIRAARAPIRLAFFHLNKPAITALSRSFKGHPQFTASVAEPRELTRQQRRLDALYVSFTEAVRRWGAHPDSHRAQVLRTRPEDSGMPPYVVAGPLIPADDPRAGDQGHELKLTLAAVLDAVKTFNADNPSPIRVVGFWTSTLGIGRMEPADAANAIISVYGERLGET
jgi:hypothetical protein